MNGAVFCIQPHLLQQDVRAQVAFVASGQVRDEGAVGPAVWVEQEGKMRHVHVAIWRRNQRGEVVAADHGALLWHW